MACEQDILLKALQEGQEGAFEQLYARYFNRLYYKALSMVGETTAAEDLVQECFIKMWEKKLWKRVNKSLESFLFIMIHNRCLDYVKSEQTQLKRKRRYFINAEQENHSWENPVDERQQRETQLQQWNDFQVTFQQLPPQQQNAFRMFYYDRKSHAEGAKLIGISLNTFRTHLKRAVKKLLHSS